MRKFVVFDLDGTLLNTLPDIAGAMNRVLKRHGLPAHPQDRFKRFTGNGARKLCERSLLDRQDLLETVYREYLLEYGASNRVDTSPYEGIPELLRELAGQRIALIVYSNKDDPDTKEVVRYYFPDVPFEVVLGSLPGVPLKPDPSALIELLERLGLESKDGIYLGDTVMDIRCAKAAKLYAVAAGWGFQTKEELMKEEPDSFIMKPGELLEIIKARADR